jgi:hypothetical protein
MPEDPSEKILPPRGAAVHREDLTGARPAVPAPDLFVDE